MKRLVLFSLGALLGLNPIAQVSNSLSTTNVQQSTQKLKYSRAKIYYNGMKGLMLLANQGIPVDHGHHKRGVFIESDFSENDINTARMLGMDVEILIDDVSAFYVERNKNLSDVNVEKNASCSGGGSSTYSYPTPTNYNHGSMGGFLTLSELYSELDDMATLYPNLITVKAPIGSYQTHEGRPIYWVRISDNPNTDEAEPEVLYTAIHHAREPEAMQQLVYYMWYLLENYATNQEVQAILDNTELYFIPMVNPDGYYHNVVNDPNGGGMHRKNKRNVGTSNPGVDNNRNYDYIDGNGNSVWGTSGVSSNTNNDTYPGTGPFSEPENQAIKYFVENHSIKLALNNHTYDNSLLYPFGYANNQLTPDNSTYVAISNMMVAQNTMTNMISASLYPAAGDSDDFMYGETSTHSKIFAFTPEIGLNSDGFWPSVNRIDPLAESMVYLNLTSAHLVSNYAKSEDLTPLIIESTTGYFNYSLQRLGLEDPSNFTVSILPITNITTVGSPNSHNSMTLLQQDIDSISYTLDANIQPGDEIKYVISVDNGQYLSNDTVTKIYGQAQIVFSDNANSLSNWTNSGWATTSSAYYSASSSITDSPNGNYSNNQDKSIELTNGVDLNNAVAASVSFYAKWEIEADWDWVQFEISTDGGSTWIPQCGNYTNLGVSDQGAADGEPLYDGFQTTWIKEEIDLTDYLGQTIKARFRLVSDGGVTEDGFYYDDFEINVVYGTSAIEELTANGAYLGQNVPNPSTNQTRIDYILPESIAIASLNIINHTGQIVVAKLITSADQKVYVNTSNLAQGVYFYYITDENGYRSGSKKMAVLK